MRKLLSVVLCLCLSMTLSSCRSQQQGLSYDDSYIEGLSQGREDFFLDLWDAAYNTNSKDCGELWETDAFSLTIKAKRGSIIDDGVVGLENAPYIDIGFTLNEGSIDYFWEKGEILFSIYSLSTDGAKMVWDSDDYYWYAILQTDADTIGNDFKAETRIYEETVRLAVIIVINGCIYTASYGVDI